MQLRWLHDFYSGLSGIFEDQISFQKWNPSWNEFEIRFVHDFLTWCARNPPLSETDFLAWAPMAPRFPSWIVRYIWRSDQLSEVESELKRIWNQVCSGFSHLMCLKPSALRNCTAPIAPRFPSWIVMYIWISDQLSEVESELEWIWNQVCEGFSSWCARNPPLSETDFLVWAPMAPRFPSWIVRYIWWSNQWSEVESELKRIRNQVCEGFSYLMCSKPSALRNWLFRYSSNCSTIFFLNYRVRLMIKSIIRSGIRVETDSKSGLWRIFRSEERRVGKECLE